MAEEEAERDDGIKRMAVKHQVPKISVENVTEKLHLCLFPVLN